MKRSTDTIECFLPEGWPLTETGDPMLPGGTYWTRGVEFFCAGVEFRRGHPSFVNMQFASGSDCSVFPGEAKDWYLTKEESEAK